MTNKIWRIYEIVDIETGEILKSGLNKHEYITIKIEKNEYTKNNQKIEHTTRIVKHNGQKRIFD